VATSPAKLRLPAFSAEDFGLRSHETRAGRWLSSCFAIGVDCWIGIAQEGDRYIVRLAGRLRRPEIPDLLQACAGTSGKSLVIDLADLVSVDFAAVDVLRKLRSEGATLVAAPGYIRMKLDSPPS
jgi:ABC-type transporter Mla MlaB component